MLSTDETCSESSTLQPLDPVQIWSVYHVWVLGPGEIQVQNGSSSLIPTILSYEVQQEPKGREAKVETGLFTTQEMQLVTNISYKILATWTERICCTISDILKAKESHVELITSLHKGLRHHIQVKLDHSVRWDHFFLCLSTQNDKTFVLPKCYVQAIALPPLLLSFRTLFCPTLLTREKDALTGSKWYSISNTNLTTPSTLMQ